MQTLSTFCILISIALLMYLAYKGWSIILIAPLLSVVAAIGCGESILTKIGSVYLLKCSEYIKNYFLFFLLGAVFAKLMEKGGLATSIANRIIKLVGSKNAVLAVIIGCAVLTYGGLSCFVVAFVMYPFGASLFKQAGIPKRLLPAALWIGIFSFTMVALPGTPQIQNIIPTTYFGTSTWAGIGTGIFATILLLGIGLLWMNFRTKKLNAQGEFYGEHADENLAIDEASLPDWKLSLIPLVMIIVLNILLSNPFNWEFAKGWQLPSIWAISISILLATIVTVLIGSKRFFPETDKASGKADFLKTVNTSALSSCTAVFNTASGFAFGCVVTSVAGFEVITLLLQKLSTGGNPLFSAVLTTNIMCGITGSASSGITIALSKFGEIWKQMAIDSGVSLDALHRIVSIAGIGIDPVPHCGALVTMFAICGLTHKESYFDLAMLMLFKFFVPYLCVIFYLLTGIV